MALIAALGLAACGADAASDGSGKTSSVTLTLGQNDPSVKVLLPASGVFDDAPYDLEFVDFTNQVDASTALTTGEIDGSFLAQYTVVQAAANAKPTWTQKTAPYRTIGVPAFIDVESHDPFGTVSSAKSGITELTAESVRGKKWTASPGATNYLTMLQTLNHLGLGIDDIEYVQLDNAAGAIALLNNEVDLASGAYSAYIETVNAGGHNLDSSHDVGPGSPSALVATTKSLGDPDKEAAWEDFTRRYAAYRVWVLENKDEYVKALVQANKVTEEAAAAQWLQFGRGGFGPVTPENVAAGQDIADLAFGEGVIPAEIDASIGYDDRFTAAIEKGVEESGLDAAIAASIEENPAQ
ncbi:MULTISPECIES: ABC transporter substrate-binding protein [unclassified Aeromicrobium]|uniref:ABC transporter substrate-binding protein n=1 Tax=unclassified Aeromicrobium TaxID=2633570 RepID=UPI00396B2220